MICAKHAYAHARPYDMKVVVVAGGLERLGNDSNGEDRAHD